MTAAETSGQPAADVQQPAARSQKREAGSGKLRLLVVHLLQLPAVGLVIASDRPAAWWAAALWSSLVCCAGTDSGWKWWNRLLVVEAIAWLVAGAVFGAG